MELLCSSHPVEVEQLLAHDGIHVEDLVKLAELEQENLLKIVLFDLPILDFAPGKFFPVLVRNMESCVIVAFVTGSALVVVLYMIILKEFW
jgi:hypothetical protein